MTEDVGERERPEDFGDDPAAVVARWLAEIKAYGRTFDPWIKRSETILKRYRDDEAKAGESRSLQKRFNILWSNIQTLQPAIYGRRPQPDVRRRFRQRDPIARAAATIVENCLSTTLDNYDFDLTATSARDDNLLTGRGQAWVRYVPTFGEETTDRTLLQPVEPEDPEAERSWVDEDGNPVDDYETDDEGNAYVRSDPYRPVVYEAVVCDHIGWGDFGHTPAPTWAKVRAVWKRELLTRDQLVDRFGKEIAENVSLTRQIAGVDDESLQKFGDAFKRAVVYEIWDKSTKQVYWVSPGHTEKPLDIRDDPLGLDGFFPCPMPLYATTTTDTLIPVADYTMYQSQAIELEELTQRISLLTRALRVVGVYNSKMANLERLVEGDDNTMIPVDQWAMMAEAGGLKGQVDFLPIKEIADVLTGLIEARQVVKQDLYEITGISDIMRGDVDPREKLGQSRIKGQWGSLRLQDRQASMQRFLRDILRMKGEVIAEHFSDDTLAEMSNWFDSQEAELLDKAYQEAWQRMQQGEMLALPPSAKQVFAAALELIRSERLRGFRIDIETDSTAFEDAEMEQQRRTQFLDSVSSFLERSIPAAQQFPPLKPLLSEMLLFGVRGFKTGRQLEAVIEETLEELQGDGQMQQMAAQAQQAEQAKAEAETQEKAAKVQIEAKKVQIDEARAQAETQLKAQELQADREDNQRQHELSMAKLNLDMQKLQQEREIAMTKIMEDRSTRAEQRQSQIDDMEMQRRAANDDRNEQRRWELENRRLDGKVTPTLEDDVKEVSEALAQVAQAMTAQAQAQSQLLENMQAQQQQTATLLGTLVETMQAPREAIRDAGGRITGARIVRKAEG